MSQNMELDAGALAAAEMAFTGNPKLGLHMGQAKALHAAIRAYLTATRLSTAPNEDSAKASVENQSLDLEGDYGRADNDSSLDDVRELLEGRP